MHKLLRHFQNWSFGNATLDLVGKTDSLSGFSKAFFKTNRVLKKALLTLLCVTACCIAQPVSLKAQSRIDDAFSTMDSAFNTQESETTLQDAYYLGRAVAATILTVYKPYTTNAELTRYMNTICQALVINSYQPESFNGYHVMVLDSQEFNAFASPGGHIFVTRKLVETALSEDMLAAVIAHELAHIMLKHSIGIINDMSLAIEAEAMAHKAANMSGSSAAAKRLMLYRNGASRILDTIMKNGYSQPQEFDADRHAAALMVDAGYDPAALTEMLKILQKVQGSSKGGFNTTHPSPAQRIANVEKLRYRIPDTRAYRTPRFKNK